MTVISKNIKKLRESVDLSQEQLAERIGKTRSAVSQYESGKIVSRMGVIEDMSTVFGVQKSALIGDAPLSVPGARRAVPASMVRVPVLGRVHAGPAGDPDLFEGSPKEAEILSYYFDIDPECYVLDFEGDCMSKDFGEAASLVVSPNSSFGDGSIVVAVVDDVDYVVRRLAQSAKEVRLQPNSWNPEYEDIVVSCESGRQVDYRGKVIGCFKRFD